MAGNGRRCPWTGFEIQEQGAEIVVEDVQIVLVNRGGARNPPRIPGTGRRVMPALRAHYPGTLLRLADMQHPLGHPSRANAPACARPCASRGKSEQDPAPPPGRSARSMRQGIVSSAPSARRKEPENRATPGSDMTPFAERNSDRSPPTIPRTCRVGLRQRLASDWADCARSSACSALARCGR